VGFRVQGLGCRVWGAGFRVQGLGCRVWGAGFRVQGWRFTARHALQGARAFVARPGPVLREAGERHVHLLPGEDGVREGEGDLELHARHESRDGRGESERRCQEDPHAAWFRVNGLGFRV